MKPADTGHTVTWAQQLSSSDRSAWEAFVHRHRHATFAHLPGLSEAFTNAYGLPAITLGAFRTGNEGNRRAGMTATEQPKLVGLLPMVRVRPLPFGSELVSMPFLDTGGVLAQDRKAGETLVNEALRICTAEKIQRLEFRQAHDQWPRSGTAPIHAAEKDGYNINVQRWKVRMVLELPDSADTLMAGFKAKLRSQIRKPLRDGLIVKTGRLELLDHFYEIFCLNMRDLGSPVHSKAFFQAILESLPASAHILIAYLEETPLAAGFVVGFGEWLYNPWASAHKAYKKLNANMLLYWHMLEFGCRRGFKYFDFGRSTPDEGTYKFKAQWGAVAQPLAWSVFSRRALPADGPVGEKGKYALAINCWKKFPLGLTRFLGPKIRKHISL